MRQEEALDQISFMRQLVEDTKLIVAGGYPLFILWGCVWVVGYLSRAAASERTADRIWGFLIVGAILLQMIILYTFRRRPGWGSTSLTKKLLRINLVLVAAMLYLPVMVTPDVAQGIVTGGSSPDLRLYIPFWIGVIYVINGVFLGREMIAIGGWIMLSVAAARFLPGDAQNYWMAVAGGGSLVLTGVLLRNTYRAAIGTA